MICDIAFGFNYEYHFCTVFIKRCELEITVDVNDFVSAQFQLMVHFPNVNISQLEISVEFYRYESINVKLLSDDSGINYLVVIIISALMPQYPFESSFWVGHVSKMIGKIPF